jgi:RNA polymerase sigma-70 factor (ECF subfamily)
VSISTPARASTLSPTERERFSEIFRVCHRPVTLYVRRRTADPSVVEEAVAETFTIAWQRFAEVPDPALPWLIGTARKVLANEFRRVERRQRLRDGLGVLSRGQPHAADIARDVAARDELARAVARLSPGDREVLLLAAWEELSLPEIAQALQITTKAAGVRLHRARRRLESRLHAPDSGQAR